MRFIRLSADSAVPALALTAHVVCVCVVMHRVQVQLCVFTDLWLFTEYSIIASVCVCADHMVCNKHLYLSVGVTGQRAEL